MPLLHLFVLSLVQGITEFLPISSSGHLVLTWEALESNVPEHDQLIVDIAVHVGTLAAVCGYFWRDIWDMLTGVFAGLAGRPTAGTRLAIFVVLATLPVIVAGFLLKDVVDDLLRSAQVIAWTTLGFGLLLYVADKAGAQMKRIPEMRWADALIIGMMQVLALVPGTSRSGITMTAGRLLGYDRREAARFSMLLAIPAIAGAGTLAGLDVYESGNLALGLDALIAAAMAFVAAWIAIALLMRWLAVASFTPFVVYRIALGGLLLTLIYTGVL
ncbi:undecaprenyl-diphosphate phosphatase [Rhodovibrio salinarum]|uniref:Undecaprenyl-diphosphatase n=1 Tax=Rhodovibrio salinarum TaxID=1087 RepID=A0A934QKW6_9PROT|nr:undecaprenyl-diphosphate phosphatase [Rhodovibrio salinarum]MBK1698796.1 undecaprenyl-diphosphate phosphatase [Rhodovibrio salinarum]